MTVAPLNNDIDRLAAELDANYKQASFDYSIVKGDLDDLLPAISNSVASAAPTLIQIEKALPMVLGLQMKVNSLTWSTIQSLCLAHDDGIPDYIFAAPPLTRTILDSLLNTLFMFDDPEKNVHWFLLAGWCEQNKELNRYRAEYGNDPTWARWLEFAKADIAQTERFLVTLSDDEKRSPEMPARGYWPNPGKMGIVNPKNPKFSYPMVDPDREAFVKHMKHWHYGRLSGESHLSLLGLIKRGALYLPQANDTPLELLAARTRYMYLTAAFSVFLALMTEIAIVVEFPRDRLLTVWQRTARAWPDVAELYVERYKRLLT
jgi:hypothetical protein